MSLVRYCIEPSASASPDSVFVNDSTLLSVVTSYTTGLSYNWDPATYLNNPTVSNPIAIPTSSTPDNKTYVVTVTDSIHGCTEKDTVTIYIRPLGFYTFPDAFTPNADGVNDYYYPLVTTGATILEFRIFNRWGDVVYDGTTAPGWDGKFLGTDQPIGSYVYYTRVRYPDAVDASIMHETTYTGTITLIR
jgi:gliding motility-associated-like protein